MHIKTSQTRVKGRTHIRVSATPKNPETRALLQEFKAGVRQLEKKWKAIAKARAKTKK